MPYSPEYKFRWAPQVRDALSAAPDPVRVAFVEHFLPALQLYPHKPPGHETLGVLPLKHEKYGHMYTVPISGGEGLLTFQVLQDYPIIVLRHIVWL